MKISTKGRYALRVMLDLAQHSSEGFITVKEISERQDITVKYMEQIISQLTKAGHVKSLRGSNGGYKLAKAPNEYTAGSILRAIEGRLAPVSCIEDSPNQCRRCNNCPTLPFWQGLDKIIKDYMDSVTLEDLLTNQKNLVT